jgi:soluble lytic murein transglycosylase-like protein
MTWLRTAVVHATLVVAGALVVGAFAAWSKGLRATGQADRPPVPVEVEQVVAALERELAASRGELEVTRLQLERAGEILRYSTRYRIPADLSAAIYDIALAEGIHPTLGFQLVKVESGFRPLALSPMGAIGFTQIRLPTARAYVPGITAEELADRDTNLRLGFRYFRDLLRRFHHDLDLALVAYNRGPTLVDSIVTEGGDPSNGYSEAVLRGVSQRVRSAQESLRRGS